MDKLLLKQDLEKSLIDISDSTRNYAYNILEAKYPEIKLR